MGYVVPLLFFNKDGYRIKYPKKVDMPLKNPTKIKPFDWLIDWLVLIACQTV